MKQKKSLIIIRFERLAFLTATALGHLRRRQRRRRRRRKRRKREEKEEEKRRSKRKKKKRKRKDKDLILANRVTSVCGVLSSISQNITILEFKNYFS